jgi:hypothetical protein
MIAFGAGDEQASRTSERNSVGSFRLPARTSNDEASPGNSREPQPGQGSRQLGLALPLGEARLDNLGPL